MTTQEFEKELKNANTLLKLKELRKSTASSKFVCMIKEKINKIAKKEGFELFKCTTTTLKNLTRSSDANQLSEIVVPEKNKTLAKYAGMKVKIYIQSKINGGEGVEFFVKKTR